MVHVPPKEVRDQKNLLRQRFWLVKLLTMLKNRTHNVLNRNHLKPPEKTDLFGSYGRAWMNALSLSDPDGRLLKSDLELLDTIRSQIRQTEKWMRLSCTTFQSDELTIGHVTEWGQGLLRFHFPLPREIRGMGPAGAALQTGVRFE